LAAVGILGGSFNPPHLGHLRLAQVALDQLELERVLLVPVHRPPHKPVLESDPGPQHRLAMCKLLVEGAEPVGRLAASEIEVRRGGRSYTVDTLEQLRAADRALEPTLILGSDVALTIDRWREPRRILELARIAVAPRGEGRAEVERALRRIDPDARVIFLTMAAIEISSTRVRERLADGRPVHELVGEAVADYIETHHLYRPAALVG